MIAAGLQRYWYYFFGALTAIIIATACAFSVPLLVQAVLDAVLLGGDLPPFAWIRFLVQRVGGVPALRGRLPLVAVTIISITAVGGFFSFLAGRWSAVGAECLARDQRDKLYSRIQSASLAWHHTVATGDLMQRCTSDVETVRKFFAVQLVELGRAMAMVLLAVPLMVRLHPRLTLVAVALIPLAFGYTWWFFLRVQETFLASDEAEAELSTVLQEHLTGLRVVRSLAREPEEVERFGAVNTRYRTVTMHLLRVLARYWGISTALVMVQTGAVLIAGILMGVTVGTLTAFLLLEQMLLWPVRQMGMVLADLGKARVAQGRIEEILAVPDEDHDPALAGPGTGQPSIRGRVVFEDVSFGYDRIPVLQNVSFVAEPGMTVGILGATGSGKTTMMMLLARLIDPQAGRILIDDTDISLIDRQWLRHHIGFVLQEPFLYGRSIRDNISFARSSAGEAEVIAAARAAAVHDVIKEFQNGYETEVGERGVTLSGGQKQRVAIARALLMDTPILVFDDSLSAVDNRTDARIREALLAREATTFLVTHRTTSLARVDLVLVLDEGRIVEYGTPRELRGRDGHFHRTWELQQGDYHDEGQPR